MPYKNEFEALSGHFQNAWERWNADIPIAWPNVEFVPPDPPSPWLRFSLQNGQSGYISVGVPGKNVLRYTGVLSIQIFVPVRTGEGLCRALADDVLSILRNKTIENIRFSAVYAESVSNSLVDGWLQMNVTAPFTRDEFE